MPADPRGVRRHPPCSHSRWIDAPSITAARKTVPTHVAAALAQALEKLPADRFESVAEFATALGDESFTYQGRPRTAVSALPTEVAAVPTLGARTWLRDPRSMASFGVALLAVLYAVATFSGPPEVEAPLRVGAADFEVRAPLGTGRRLAISRDGSHLAVLVWSARVRWARHEL